MKRKKDRWEELRKVTQENYKHTEYKRTLGKKMTQLAEGKLDAATASSSGGWQTTSIGPYSAPMYPPQKTYSAQTALPLEPQLVEGLQELAEALGLKPSGQETGVVLTAEDGQRYSILDVMLAFVRFFKTYKACPECGDIFKTDEDDYICKRCRSDVR